MKCHSKIDMLGHFEKMHFVLQLNKTVYRVMVSRNRSREGSTLLHRLLKPLLLVVLCFSDKTNMSLSG